MNPTRLVLEKRYGRLQDEEQKLALEATARGIPIVLINEKALSRNKFKFLQGDMVAGSVMFVKHAVRMHGHKLAEHKPYPDCLKHLMYREVSSCVLRQAMIRLDNGGRFFIKPATWKSFTGFVAEYSNDFRFNGVSKYIRVYISDIVKFVSEYRVYVANGEIVDIQGAPCEGGNDVVPDYPTMIQAVHVMTACGVPDGYAIDFGVLSTGETALVEMNDGFAIGAYGSITNKAYFDVIWARWQQLSRGEI